MKMCKPVRDYAEERVKIAVAEAVAEAKEEANKEKEKAVAMKSVQYVDTLLNEGFSLNEALEIVNIDEETYNKYKSV